MLDIALARTDHDFILSGRSDAPPGRRPARPVEAGQRQPAKARAKPFSAMKYLTSQNLAVAALAAITLGFLVNALALQKTRHPAPLFAPAPMATEAAVPAAKLADSPLPQPRPADLATLAPLPSTAASKPAAAARAAAKTDQIALLLRPHVAPAKADLPKAESSKKVLAAQRALLKLGFVLKADGVAGGTTRQAIERFERDHGMPVRGDLTPKMMRLLTTASGLPGE